MLFSYCLLFIIDKIKENKNELIEYWSKVNKIFIEFFCVLNFVLIFGFEWVKGVSFLFLRFCRMLFVIREFVMWLEGLKI